MSAMTNLHTTTLAVLTLAGLLAGCGDSSDSEDVASVSEEAETAAAEEDAADVEAELLDWVQCMRDEGIDLDDPVRDADGNVSISGDGLFIGGGSASPAVPTARGEDLAGDEGPIDLTEMEAAMAACGEAPVLGARNISDEDLQAQQEAALEFARCIRGEGIEDFPDPDFSSQGPGGRFESDDSEGAGSGPVIAGPFGRIELGDPEVAAAFEACQSVFGPPDDGPGFAGGDGDA
jgi:hypothetical protein